MPSNATVPVDGRRARRERSRVAVIDAVFALVKDGNVPPTVEQIAEQSGVSVSSIFRMFDGLDDMRAQAFAQFEDRYAHRLDAEVFDGAPRAARLERFVRMRVELNVEAGPLLSMVRQRRLEHPAIADRVRLQRTFFAEQARRMLAPETESLTSAESADLIALIDVTTSPEAYEVLSAAHAHTPRRIERSWLRAVTGLTNVWCGEPRGESANTKNSSTTSREATAT